MTVKTFLITLLCAVCLLAHAEDETPVPPAFPELPEDTEDTDDNAGSDVIETTDQEATRELTYTYDVAQYANAGWTEWNTRIREWFDDVIDVVMLYPPMPKETRFYLNKGVEEVAGPFVQVVENVDPVYFDDIPTWSVRVTEEFDEVGARFFQTSCVNSICHQLPGDIYFNPQAWTLTAYGENGQLPTWLAQCDEEQIASWYEERGRERFAFMLILVPQGQRSNYLAKLAEKRAAEAEKDEISPVPEDNSPLRFTKIDVTLQSVVLDYYNANALTLGLITGHSLSQPSWEFFGEVDSLNTYAQVRVPLEEDDDFNLHFFRLLDIGTDADNDGLPDTLEIHLYNTDPTKYDTSGSGLSDWEKIFIHGLDPKITDNDNDGLDDGEEVTIQTNPLSPDTDGDGLSDLEEHYSIRKSDAESDFMWLESDAWTELYPNGETRSYYSKLYSDVPIGFPISLDDYTTSICDVDVTGRLILRNMASSEPTYSSSGNINLLRVNPFKEHALIAGHWDDMEVSIAYNSSIRHATIQQDGKTYFVVEYKNIRLYSGRTDETGASQFSMQIIIQQKSDSEALHFIYVSFKDVGANITGAGATIGIKLPLFNRGYLYAYDTANVVTNNMTLTYTLGAISSPCNSDTDNDKLNDYEEVISYKTSPIKPDTDADGLTDFEETCITFTNPLIADMDEDTLPDGWEVRYGLSPTNSAGIHGATGDPDNDNIPNAREFQLGSHPQDIDTDDDGLLDAEEAGYMVRQTLHTVSTLTNVQSIDALITNVDDDRAILDLSTPITLKGITYSRIAVDLNGRIGLVPSDISTVTFYSNSYNKDLHTFTENRDVLLIAPYWDDLRKHDNTAAAIDFGKTLYSGTNCLAVEYRNIGLDIYGNSNVMTMRVLVPYDNSDRIIVQYISAHEQFNGSDATLGVRQPNAKFALQYSYNIETSNLFPHEIIYYLGTQTHPARADSDYDGLIDPIELSHGTNPYEPDTDDDGMSDRWEIKYGRDPLVENDGTIDSDNDGLTDKQEALYDTNPNGIDTDGDGISDLSEINQSSDPTDETDEGLPNSRHKLILNFGDDSGSHSEKYALRFTQIAGDGQQELLALNEEYGEVQQQEVFLKTDAVYRLTMNHTSSNLDTPDRDYTLTITPPEESYILIVDEDNLVGSEMVDDGEPFPGEGKEVFIYCFDSKIIPDYNRDAVINTYDKALAAQATPLPMWINDDSDEDIENGVNAGDDSSVLFGRDCADAEVNGKSDIEDFFPVKIQFGEAFSYYLQQYNDVEIELAADNALGLLWCTNSDFSLEQFYQPQEDENDLCFGVTGNMSRWNASVATSSMFSSTGKAFPNWLLNSIRNGEASEVLLFLEGKQETELPLSLTVKSPTPFWTGSNVADVAQLPLTIKPVTQMYSTLNIRTETANFTPAQHHPTESSKLTAFIHGYSVSEEDAEGWFNTVFKRLWQSGLNTHFCGITWNGDEQGVSPDYYRNVENAFIAAGRLDVAFSTAPLAGYTNKTMLAHSLGNMVVSAAIQDHALNINNYMMLNAAVPAEAYDMTPVTYDFTTSIPRGLIHDDWINVAPQAWANFWHRHFIAHGDYTPTDTDNARSTLTWHGRFKDVLANRGVEVYNYYSSGTIENNAVLGDEVFELMEETPDPVDGFHWFGNKGQYSWQKQECYKGRYSSLWTFAFAASDIMGWGVEDDVTVPTTDEAYRTTPYFYHNPTSVLEGNVQVILEQRDALLAYGIPAMTNAVGRQQVSLGVQKQVNLQDYSTQYGNAWARGAWESEQQLQGRWLHSDIKDVTYPFTRAFYKDLIQKGNLQ